MIFREILVNQIQIHSIFKAKLCDDSFTFILQKLKAELRCSEQNANVISRFRSSRPEEFCKKGVLINLTKLTGKHLCQSLLFNKIACLRPATLLKKRLAQTFSCEFCEISKNTFFHRIPQVAASEICVIFC